MLDSEVTISEILQVLKNCKNRKAPGFDEITNEFQKNLTGNWLLYMCVLTNKIMKDQKMPKNWSKIIIKMIYKKGEKENSENYRSISLVCSQ